MWATNDKGVLFVQKYVNKSEDATLADQKMVV